MAEDREVWCLHLDLGAPVAQSHPFIHLDGPIAYAAGVESIGVDGLDELSDGDEPEYFTDEMPLRRYEVTSTGGDDEWVWAASAAGIATPEDAADQSAPERWSTTRWRMRFDDDPVHQVKETHINTSSGEFKSYNAALPYAATDSLTFFFEPAADATGEDVLELLKRHVGAIGKKRSQGFGRINDYRLTEATGTVESALYHNGRVLCSMPANYCTRVVPGTTIERRTVRPPYWHAENQCMAYPPFVDIPRDELAPELPFADHEAADQVAAGD